MEYHQIASMFELLSEAELQELASDIKQQGLLLPVMLFEGKILDGRNRYRACQMAEVEPIYTQFEGTPEEAVHRVWSLNRPRRHLTSDQSACADAIRNKLLNSYAAVREAAKARQTAAQAANLKRGNEPPPGGGINIPAGKTEVGKGVKTVEVRAKAAGTCASYLRLADKLLKEEPEVFAQVQKGEKRLSQVRREKGAAKMSFSTARTNGRAKIDIVARTHQDIIRLAEKGRFLSSREISEETGYTCASLDKFFTRCSFVPWVTVLSQRSEKKFVINEELKNICENLVLRPELVIIRPELGICSIFVHMADLGQEIARRRQEARAGRSNWKPHSIHAHQLVELLNFIEDEFTRYRQFSTQTPKRRPAC